MELKQSIISQIFGLLKLLQRTLSQGLRIRNLNEIFLDGGVVLVRPA